MEYKVELTARAISDIRAIYAYINAENSPQAAVWYRGLRAAIFSLDREPQRGISTAENAALRQLFYGNKPHVYRIIYSINLKQKAVKIVHIRHGAQAAFSQPNP
jgi:Plasmid stabilization system protein